jgi:GT2 family glycosyltransferase
MANEREAKPIVSDPAAPATSGYLFHLDVVPEPVTFTKDLELSGWLFHSDGEPVRGMRAVVSPSLGRKRIYQVRRKRARPAIGAAYPNLPDAAMSGFLVEVQLSFGPCEVVLEVKNEAKKWNAVFATRIIAFPLSVLRLMGLPRVEKVAVSYFAHRFPGSAKNAALRANGHEAIGPTTRRPRVDRTITAIDLFVTSKSNLFIIEIGELVRAGFEAAGLNARLLVDQIPAEETPDDKLQIVVTPHEFYNLFLNYELPWIHAAKLTENLLLLGTEQPESDWFHSNLVVAPHARAMLDINPLGVTGYRARGLRCFHLPLGYHAMLERTDSTARAEREIDVCMLAAKTDRREIFIARNADFFAAHNCHLRLVPLGFAKTKTVRSYLSEEKRNALLQRSKILLNVHYSELRYFEWHRMLIGLANRCCIISETCEGFAPLIPGKHFIMVEPEYLTTCCEYYLEYAAEREAIARAGYDFITSQLSQRDNCIACLTQITSESGHGANETDPLPNAGKAVSTVSLSNGLQERIARRTSALFRQALRDDLRAFSRGSSRKAITAGEPISNPAEDAKRIESVIERRRGYAARFAQQESAEQGGREIFQLIDNDHFRESSVPAVSVLITLYNYAQYIEQCVQSVEESVVDSIPGGIEILVVNDASTDESLRHARRIQQRSRLPIRIANKHFNTGLADARNVGLRIARAPYVFIMDADNLVQPRCVEQLHRLISNSERAAAYSMLCRFHDSPTDGVGLLSYYDWDPRMLVEHPYIDAMAMFDRQRLMEIGGYSNELYKIGWFGWEDYELWIRLADANFDVGFLPNVLCLYRHHESSMSNTTNLFEQELVEYLLNRYAGLLEKYPPKAGVFGVPREKLRVR